MLQKLQFKPGFNKQITQSGAESQYTVSLFFINIFL
jgi:hypothetical protein